MSTWQRSSTAVCFAAVLGLLVMSSPAAAAPAGNDERILLYNDEGDSPVEPGGVVTFVASTAGAPDVVQNRTVVLTLSEGLTFRAADNEHAAGPCVADTAGTTVTCTVTEPAEPGGWWVQADVADDAPLGEFVSATATLSSELPDPDPADNVSTARVFVTTGGDMSVAITAPPGPWPVGSTFDATITVHNKGPYRSPAQLDTRIVSSVLEITGWPDTCLSDSAAMECFLDVIEAGADFEINLRITVREFGLGYLSLRPELKPTAPDSDLSDNTALYRAEITNPSPSPSPSPSPTSPGQGGGDEPSLPITGAPAGPLALTGLALLAAGSITLLLSRFLFRYAVSPHRSSNG